MHIFNVLPGWRLFATIALGGMLSACASTPPPPVAALEAAEQSIMTAEQVRAAEDAPVELDRARERLHTARAAVDDGDMKTAARLAHESKALADLAFAKAEMEDARRVNLEIARTTDVLREELQRNLGEGGW